MSQRNLVLEAAELEKLLRGCFPNHAPVDHGSNAFDYIVGNIKAAVVDEIIAMVETWLETMDEASHYTALNKDVPPRDWEVAKAHIIELLSEIRQYKMRGQDSHTGAIRTVDTSEPPCDD